MLKKRIYLDNNATSCIDPRLHELITRYSFSTFGNPSSIHSYGMEAKALLINARANMAELLGVSSHEIIFTSSATEALNLILRGFFAQSLQGHLVTTDVEHLAVFATLESLSAKGLAVSYV